MNLQIKVDRIKNSLASSAYTLAASESVKIIEISLRLLLGEGLAKFKGGNRLTVIKSVMKVGKEEKDIEDLGLGAMLGVIRGSKFFELWEESTGHELSAIRMINFDVMTEVRNKLEHKGYEASKYEAEFLAHTVENIIHEFGLLKLSESDENMGEEELGAEDSISPTIKRRAVRAGKKSTYSPTEFTELHRLSVQSKICQEIDIKTFHYALSNLDKKEGLIALDLGCANGYLTHDRFEPFAAFSKVIGIDRDKDAIEKANQSNFGDRYAFYQLDAESESFGNELVNIVHNEELEKVDLIFSGLTVHHLSNPVKTLRGLRKIHKQGGVIIVRGSDDGSKLAYPDEEELVRTILNLSSSVKGYSDRQNGRKIYTQLRQSGYRKLKMFFDTKSTASMTLDEKKDFFDMCMSWRVNPLLKALEDIPSDNKLVDDIEHAKDILEDLELLFEQDEFFFSQQRISGVGFRL